MALASCIRSNAAAFWNHVAMSSSVDSSTLTSTSLWFTLAVKIRDCFRTGSGDGSSVAGASAASAFGSSASGASVVGSASAVLSSLSCASRNASSLSPSAGSRGSSSGRSAPANRSSSRSKPSVGAILSLPLIEVLPNTSSFIGVFLSPHGEGIKLFTKRDMALAAMPLVVSSCQVLLQGETAAQAPLTTFRILPLSAAVTAGSSMGA